MLHILKWIVVVYCAALAAVWFGRFKLIYPFDATRVAPNAVGLPTVREQILTTPDNLDLVVWTASARQQQPTIVYFHGNAGNLADRAQRFDRLIERGFGLVAMAYRGSSGSQGSASEASITKDSGFLALNLHNLGVSHASPVVYYGESLGTGVAIKLAETYEPDAMILEAPFTSVTDLAAAQMPIFPVRFILDQRWNSIEAIKNSEMPLLVVHGQKDRLIPVSHGEAIFANSPSKSKNLRIIQDGNHHNLWSVEGQKIIYNFLK